MARVTAHEADPLMQGLTTLYEPDEAALDIIFVHGLNGHTVQSWTHENGVCWPKDLLPSDLPQCRITAWAFMASLTDNSKPRSMSTIQDHALGLLADVIPYRRDTSIQRRPVIFIAHGIGGVVVQAALSQSMIAGDGLCHDTAGTIFLGVPHLGLKYWRVIYRVAHIILGFGTRSRSPMLLKQLMDKKTLQRLSFDFLNVLQTCPHIKICSCFETQENISFVSVVVDRPSAIFGIAGEVLLPLEADHRHLTKFFGRNDMNYIRLLGVLQSWTSDILEERTSSQDEEAHDFQKTTEKSVSQQQLSLPGSTFLSSPIEIVVGNERRLADAVVDLEATENVLSYESAVAYEQQVHTFEGREVGESLGYANVLFLFRNGVTIHQRRFMVKVNSFHPIILAGSAIDRTVPIEFDSTETGLGASISSLPLSPYASNSAQVLQISRRDVVSAGLMNQGKGSLGALKQEGTIKQTLFQGTNGSSPANSYPLHSFQENAKQAATILPSCLSLNNKVTTPVTTVVQTALDNELVAVSAAVTDAAGWTSTQTIAATAVGVAGGALGSQAVSTLTTRQSLAVSRAALDVSRQSAAASGRSATAAENALELNREVFNYNRRRDSNGFAGVPLDTNPTDDDELSPFSGDQPGSVNNKIAISLSGYSADPSNEFLVTATRPQYNGGVDDTTFHGQRRPHIPHSFRQSLKGKGVDKSNDGNQQNKELPTSSKQQINELREMANILACSPRSASSNFQDTNINDYADTILQKPRLPGSVHQPWNKKTLLDYGFKRTTSSLLVVGKAGSSQSLATPSQLNDELIERKDLPGTLVGNHLGSPRTSTSMEEYSDDPNLTLRNQNEEHEPTDEQLVEVELWIESTSGRPQFSDSTAEPEGTFPRSDTEGEIFGLRLIESPDAVDLHNLASNSTPNEGNCQQP